MKIAISEIYNAKLLLIESHNIFVVNEWISEVLHILFKVFSWVSGCFWFLLATVGSSTYII